MAKKKMYQRGEVITNIAHLVYQIEGGAYIFLGNVPKNPRWIKMMSLETILKFLDARQFFIAEKTEKLP